jgi:UDP-N-acetylglucosamine 2-epimerase (non-hydrolysing)/GDP/UDP-N,N'-diacetylbacillosamine 2-epimerase (hydrolysing)
MRRLGVVTVGRSDYGLYRPILRRIQEEASLALQLIVGGAHLSPDFGLTVKGIEADGFPIADRVPMLLSSDEPQGIAKSMGLGVVGFAEAYARCRPDLLLVLGDRFEMHAAAVAALPFTIPVAHIHGGESTEGAIDEALRHCITKLSHLHFVAADAYARRLVAMGEEPWRVTVSGAPGLDAIHALAPLDAGALQQRLGIRWNRPPLVVAFHPVTLEYEQAEWQTQELLEAIRAAAQPVLFALPNADTHGRRIRRMIEAFVEHQPESHFVEHMDSETYLNLLRHAAALVGNSSSGIIEAPSLGLPAVNIGTRQQGRVRAGNVIDVGYSRQEILDGLREALAPAFRERLAGAANPYGDGRASEIIVSHLVRVPLDDRLLRKRFAEGVTVAGTEPPRVVAGIAGGPR